MRISLSHGLKRQWDSHYILLVSYMLTLLTTASHCLLVSWSHETMRFSWYSLCLIYVNPPHRCFSLSPCLMVSQDNEILMLYWAVWYGRSAWYGRWPCVGVDWIRLYDMAGAHGMAGGRVWQLIGSGCTIWQAHVVWQVAMWGGRLDRAVWCGRSTLYASHCLLVSWSHETMRF